MPEPIRAAVLGTGHGHSLGKARVLRDSPDWEFVGVCEPDPEALARKQADPNWAGMPWKTEAELLEDPTIRMIAAEGEVWELLDEGEKVIAAGKHLHLDKPAGTDLPRFRRLLDEAQRQGLLLQMGYMFRYNPGFDLLRQAVAEGWLGRIYAYHCSINTDIRAEGRKKLAFHPGGMMLELPCHLLDILVLLAGRPERVTPFLRHDGPYDDDLKDNTLAILEFEQARALVECASLEGHAFSRRSFQVLGTEGTFVLQPLEPPTVRLALREPRGGFAAGWQSVEVPNLPRYVRDLEELAACIRGERKFPYSYEHDYLVQETVLRCSGA
ncbi:MAG: Gfo/Idh/MocA family oxidoreductase [Armatimonadetes bacterium]|nr:Gfo/Idh/MocA family oxidoreductase [Armatimonadota bacterium]